MRRSQAPSLRAHTTLPGRVDGSETPLVGEPPRGEHRATPDGPSDGPHPLVLEGQSEGASDPSRAAALSTTAQPVNLLEGGIRFAQAKKRKHVHTKPSAHAWSTAIVVSLLATLSLDESRNLETAIKKCQECVELKIQSIRSTLADDDLHPKEQLKVCPSPCLLLIVIHRLNKHFLLQNPTQD